MPFASPSISSIKRAVRLNPSKPDSRPSPSKRGYGWRWQKLRKMALHRHPMCSVDGCNQPATDVDHVIAKRFGGKDTLDNLQPLCKSCHSIKTAKGL